jgi:hypothetical protein
MSDPNGDVTLREVCGADDLIGSSPPFVYLAHSRSGED